MKLGGTQIELDVAVIIKGESIEPVKIVFYPFIGLPLLQRDLIIFLRLIFFWAARGAGDPCVLGKKRGAKPNKTQ